MRPHAPPAPRLSIVAASRNDDHGGDPLIRTQLFINALAFLAEKHHVPIEVILVDWNPVPDRPGLAGVLCLPDGTTCCTGRVITVPAELHRRFKYSDVLGFFQMIAKNVGLRRARGEFLLATNIDILFSEELFRFMASAALERDRHYRVDRFDIPSGLPVESSLEQILAHTQTEPLRVHRRFGPHAVLCSAALVSRNGSDALPDNSTLPAHVRWNTTTEGLALEVQRDAPPRDIHTNGCGDFALMSREAWSAVRGYPEFEAFSFNLDSIGLLQAHYGGVTEVALQSPCAAFHLEHNLGSGWSPEGEQKLLTRLAQKQILNPDWRLLQPLVERLRASPHLLHFNRDSWGLAAFDLPEEPLQVGRPFASSLHPRPARDWPDAPVCALSPEFDLDRLFLWQEREETRATTSTLQVDVSTPEARSFLMHEVQLFWPADDCLSEENSVIARDALERPRRIVFEIPACAVGSSLRLDPTHQPGLVEIHSIEILSRVSGRVLWSAANNPVSLLVSGTAQRLGSRVGGPVLTLLSTGYDPQVALPPEGVPVSEPLLVCVELCVHPVQKAAALQHS